jgi:nucleotide-binding universal stress UspA family protein
MAKILLAYDGSEAAQRALTRAATLTKNDGAELTVISVVPVLQGAGRGGGIDPTSGTEEHKKLLGEARSALDGLGIRAQTVEAVGHPAETICRVAEEGGFDTIVMGSRGLNVVERFLIGSVSDRVIRQAHCDVVVVR